MQNRSKNGAVFQRVLKSRKLETGELEFDTDYARSIRTCNQRAVGFAEWNRVSRLAIEIPLGNKALVPLDGNVSSVG